METQNNGEQRSSQNEQRSGRNAPQGFEGMNFEEQRSSYNNGNNAGASWSREENEPRNGESKEE